MINIERDVATIGEIDAAGLILDVVCRVTGMRFAAVARVTEDRWVACRTRDEIGFGLAPGGELELCTTICNEIRQSGQRVVIDHVAQDAVFARHPTPERYGFQSYISVPIRRPDGTFFGTLCAIDPLPVQVNTPDTITMFTLFADLIGFHLDAHERLSGAEERLEEERRAVEQFVAVLGHDLRNPLASIDAGVATLSRAGLGERAAAVLALMRGSVRRMAELIADVTDYARGRLGGGLSVERDADAPLAPVLEQVVAELRAAWPERRIVMDLDLNAPVSCDRLRIGQLASNLVANALRHGAADSPVGVRARTGDGVLTLSVSNAGTPIAADAMTRLFEPFFRGGAENGEGLGLGLYIASEIARAHGGTLSAASTPDETRFTLVMPLS